MPEQSPDDDEYGSDEEQRWPEQVLDVAAVRGWIAAQMSKVPAADEVVEVVGPLVIHQAKEWGITASFAIITPSGGREVIFKAAWLRLFASAPPIAALLSRTCPDLVPELLDWEAQGDMSWSLFAVSDGQPVEELQSQRPLQAIARTLAQIQTTIAALPQEERATLPRVALALLPRLYEAVLNDVHERYASYWADEGRDLAEQFALPTDIVPQMEQYTPYIAAWTEELLAGGWPESLDHVDLHAGNALLRSDGTVLIYDWEEANLSYPFFSLDRLLDDARELEPPTTKSISTAGGLAYTPAERALRDAYLTALPWRGLAARERAFDLAICLAPIKTAYESIVLAEALGWEEGSPHIIAWALGRALPRWRVLAG